MEFSIKGVEVIKPHIYVLGAMRQKPVVISSDAKWTVLDEPPWFRKGLGGVTWDGDAVSAAAIDTPQHMIPAGSPGDPDHPTGTRGSGRDAYHVRGRAPRTEHFVFH